MHNRTSYNHEHTKIGVGDIVGLVLIAGAVTVGLLWFA